ncbi:pyridoxal-phosphate-dependent aminotransferase family protein [Cetobacterium sp. SF1]|uniref:pyridoxal-phosphate-dependent aminotransferase family protein n=1 Tax=unclassified Cetobacterium TaxID=2630983 RepID=UPI003CEEB296
MFNTYKPDYLVMTAGPTMVSGNVLQARSKNPGNSDLDPDFFVFYDNICNKLKKFFGTEKGQILIMNGEGMLGLDGAIASLTEPGDEVLVIANGVFGEGFADLVKIYDGNPTIISSDSHKSIDLSTIEEALKEKSNYKYATIVHCDTPTGILNDIAPITKLLKSKGILTLVDTVAAMGGVEFKMDDWSVDIALGASQKVISAPSGLSFLAVSEDAWKVILNRKTSVKSFYGNLQLWKNCVENQLFPYTMPSSDLMGLNVALDNLLTERLERVWDRHLEMQGYVLERMEHLKLELFCSDNYSPTVTAFMVPEDLKAQDILDHMKNTYKILIAGSYGPYKDKVLRIGHMGENARLDRIFFTLDCLEKTLEDLRK